MKSQLTHFTRFIPATAVLASTTLWMKLGLWSGMGLLIILNIVIRFNNFPLTQATYTINDRVLTAKKLVMQGHINLAAAELFKLANTTTNVLGEMTSESTPLSSWQNQNETLQNQLAYWEEVVTNYPEYRDAYLSIAQIGYLLNKPEIISENLRKAAMLDPNGTSVKMLETLTK